jgi:hypothetical protein
MDDFAERFTSSVLDGNEEQMMGAYCFQQPGDFDGGSVAAFCSFDSLEGTLDVVEILKDGRESACFARSWDDAMDEMERGSWEAYKPLSAADVESDGFSELIVQGFYFEGSSRILIDISPDAASDLAVMMAFGA